MLFLINTHCPFCHSKSTKVLRQYLTKENGFRNECCCEDCHLYFSETKNTPLERIKKPVSLVCRAITERNGGMGFNETCRSCGIVTNTLLSWERKFESLKNTLMAYVLMHKFLTQIIEGDELYTRIKQNVPALTERGMDDSLNGKGEPFYL